jgi:lysozyme
MPSNSDILAILVPQLERDEGVKTVAYLDTKGNVTWGVGHMDNSVKVGTVFTMDQVNAQCAKDCQAVLDGLDYHLPWWRNLDAVRGDVLDNIAFNVGIGGLLEFHHMLAAAQAGDWDGMGSEIIASQIAPNRRQRLATQAQTGIVQ